MMASKMMVVVIAILSCAAAGAAMDSPSFCPVMVPVLANHLKLRSHRVMEASSSSHGGTESVTFPEAIRIQKNELSEYVTAMYTRSNARIESSRNSMEDSWARKKAALKTDIALLEQKLARQTAQLEDEWRSTLNKVKSLKPAAFSRKATRKSRRRFSKGEEELFGAVARSVSPRSIPPQ